MELRHLKMLLEVSESKNLTRAAERLYLTQSALSIQLKQLETFLDLQLFVRKGKLMLLTKKGEVVLQHCKRILSQLDQMMEEVKTLNDKEAGLVSISTECYTSYPWLSAFLKEFRAQYPRVEVELNTAATRFALKSLLENEIDVGIFDNDKSAKVEYTPLFSDELFVLVAPDHRLASQKWVASGKLKDDSYIMYQLPEEESSIYRTLFKSTRPKNIHKLALTEGILEMVKAGLGFTIQPNWIAYEYIKAGTLVPIRITKKGMRRTWYAGVLKGKVHPPYITDFIKALKRSIKQSEPVQYINLIKCMAS